RTSNMSAFPDRPGHFIDWLVAGAPPDQPLDARQVAHDFVSRGRYGDYIASLLDDAAGDAGQQRRLYQYPTDVVELTEQPSHGTGLSMVAVVLVLTAGGHTGPILALSRRGLRSHVQAATAVYHDLLGISAAPATALGVLRRIRGEIEHAAPGGAEWRSVLDAV